MNSGAAIKVVLFIFMGALIVLVLTHAQGFSTAVTAVGGQVSNIAGGLSGQGFPTTSKPPASQQSYAGQPKG